MTTASVTAERPGASDELSRRRINLIFGTVLLAMLLSALDQTIVSTALPTIVADVGGAGHLSWVVSSYLLAETVATVLAGKFGDLFGRKLMLQVSAGLFILASAACGFATDMVWLIGARAVQGIGAGGLMVTATALIGDVIPLRDRGKYQGALGSVFGATTVLVARARRLDRPLQVFLAALLALTVCFVPVVAAFASVFSQRIEERNMFYLAPLFLVALLAWVERGAVRPRVLSTVAAISCALVVLLLPFDRFLTTSAITDTLMLLPFWSLQDRVGDEWVEPAAFALAVGLAAAFLFVPRRYAIALPLLVLGLWVLALRPIWWGTHGLERFSRGALFQGIRAPGSCGKPPGVSDTGRFGPEVTRAGEGVWSWKSACHAGW